MRAGTGTTVPARRTRGRSRERGKAKVATLQQVCRRIPAPAAKSKRPKKAADLGVPVQIERNVSLSTEVQQKAHTVPGTGAGVGAGACVC